MGKQHCWRWTFPPWPSYSQSLTALHWIFLLQERHVVNLLSKSDNLFPVSVAFFWTSFCLQLFNNRIHYANMQDHVNKKEIKNLSQCFSLLSCVGKLTVEEMHLSRKNHWFNSAIQSLLKSCCVNVEQHAGRYFMKMENNLWSSSHWAFYPTHISHFSLCDKA